METEHQILVRHLNGKIEKKDEKIYYLEKYIKM